MTSAISPCDWAMPAGGDNSRSRSETASNWPGGGGRIETAPAEFESGPEFESVAGDKLLEEVTAGEIVAIGIGGRSEAGGEVFDVAG